MARILAIDYGRKRVGIAVSDPMQIIATSLDTIETKNIWDFLEDYFKKEEVECVVIGYPMQLNNQPSDSVRYINPFIGRFRKVYPEIQIFQYDERFTSKIAFQSMIDSGINKKRRQDKALVDKISANLILQSFLESRKR